MSMTTDQLAKTSLCRDLTTLEISRIVEAGRIEAWPAGSVIMEEGSNGPRLVILLEGTVSVHKRNEALRGQFIAELGPGAVLGEMSLLRDAPRSATVRATTALRLFAMDRRNFEEMARDGDPAALKLGVAIARVLAKRVEQLNQRLVDLLSHEAVVPMKDQDSPSDTRLTAWEFTGE